MATLYEDNVKRLVDEKRKKLEELQQQAKKSVEKKEIGLTGILRRSSVSRKGQR
jgi:hypothetical protein